ncbi:hypothetical protein ACFL1G_10860 [Planctomycetota bacterium]
MKEPLERFVTCKCSHPARLYHDPRGGCIKANPEAAPKFFVGSPDSTDFWGWVISKCKREKCKNYDKPVPLSEDDFKEVPPPCCPVCKHKMTPYRDNRGKGNYRYKCENEDCEEDIDILFADLLPNLAD